MFDQKRSKPVDRSGRAGGGRGGLFNRQLVGLGSLGVRRLGLGQVAIALEGFLAPTPLALDRRGNEAELESSVRIALLPRNVASLVIRGDCLVELPAQVGTLGRPCPDIGVAAAGRRFQGLGEQQFRQPAPVGAVMLSHLVGQGNGHGLPLSGGLLLAGLVGRLPGRQGRFQPRVVELRSGRAAKLVDATGGLGKTARRQVEADSFGDQPRGDLVGR